MSHNTKTLHKHFQNCQKEIERSNLENDKHQVQTKDVDLELLTVISQWREEFAIPKEAIESDLFVKIVEMCRDSPNSFDQIKKVLISNHVTGPIQTESIKGEPPILT